jgi:DNA-directed RNA polymerase specialized sigma24 family protein
MRHLKAISGSENSMGIRVIQSRAVNRQARKSPSSAVAVQAWAQVEDSRTVESLRKIVAVFAGDRALQQDLMQECWLCLWRAQHRYPGRTRSWYLQHCRFHVQHYLALGRSVDSLKRVREGSGVAIDGDDEQAELAEYHTNGELFEAVSFQDVVSTLARHLNPGERPVLRGLAEGLLLREVASTFALSYPTALKYRNKIAALAIKLGICSPRSIRKRRGDLAQLADLISLPGTAPEKPDSVVLLQAA